MADVRRLRVQRNDATAHDTTWGCKLAAHTAAAYTNKQGDKVCIQVPLQAAASTPEPASWELDPTQRNATATAGTYQKSEGKRATRLVVPR